MADQQTLRTSSTPSSAKAWFAAVTAALIALCSSLATALGGTDAGWDSITAGQWLTAVIAALTALGITGGGTWQIANKPH
ncbi:hypothetical protein [Vallicoccus soli]|uniref:Holin n=1 Tax=Vallicoccus soli TaxID=2339232 RepID=A0A3A3Z5M2_9ACTN|nr:hypothetical protein [Vallicoccus soli]RJK95904.1 hypothetical protein D5H78_09885 [Vallicoccus soli]